MKLVLNCTTADSDDLIAHAIVSLDADGARLILRRRDLLLDVIKADPDATCIEFDATVWFYKWHTQIEEALGSKSMVLVSDEFTPDGPTESDDEDDAIVVDSECDTLVVMSDRVWWSCLPPVDGATVTTDPVTYDVIQSIADGTAKPIALPTEPAPPEIA